MVIATRHDTHAEYAARALARRQARVRREAARARRGGAGRRWRPRTPTRGGVLHGRLQPPLRAAGSCALREALGERGPLVMTLPRQRRPAAARALDARPGGRRRPHRRRGLPLRRRCAFLAGAPPVAAQALRRRRRVRAARGRRRGRSCASRTGRSRPIVYAAFGDPSLPKERIEVLGEAGAGVLDDFRDLTLHRGGHETVARGAARQGPRGGARGVRRGLPDRPAAVARRGHGRRDARDVRDPRRGARRARSERCASSSSRSTSPRRSGATQNRLGAFAHGLAERGHRVTVVCEQPNHPAGRVPPRATAGAR